MKQSTKWFLIISGILVFIGFWMTIFILILKAGFSSGETEVIRGNSGRIALVEISGPIYSSDETVRQLKKYRDDNSIKAILLRVESPGGGVVASQEIYEEVCKTRESGKPMVVSMGALAASGGYYVSCGASKIVANKGTLTGSIGVISEFLRVDPLLTKLGIEANTIKSGKLKDAGSPFREMTTVDRAYFQNLMDVVHRQFIAAVENERSIDHDSLVAIADGRVFTGEEALDLGLVDTLGTFEDALSIAASLAGIEGEPTLVKERRRGLTLMDRLLGETKIEELFGLKDELLNRPVLEYRMPRGF